VSRPAAEFVAEVAGLDASTLGAGALDAAVVERCAALGVDEDGLVARLRSDPAEADGFLARLLVHETWLFRDRAPYELLGKLATRSARERHLPLRVLSFPCATGEEPWSIAATLLDGGISPGDFRVLACDLDPGALAVARRGVYPLRAFRGNQDLPAARRFRRRPDEDGGEFVEAPSEARESVEFRCLNLLDASVLAGDGPFDAIFCRNALVYMGRDARRQVVAALRSLLAPGGMLVVGHSEVPTLLALGFRPFGPPGAFAATADERAEPFRETARATAGGAARAGTGAQQATARQPLPPIRATREPSAAPVRSSATRPEAAEARAGEAADGGRVASGEVARGGGAEATGSVAIDRGVAPETRPSLAEARRLADTGRLDEASRLVRAHLEHEPTSAEAHLLQGVLLVAERREDEARAALERAVYLDPSCEEALVHLAAIAERAGDRPGAARFRARAARIEARS